MSVQAKLDAGEECLSNALPCDVAGLVKQFFRELPEPVLPIELQEAFFKAQQLPAEEERTSATILLSCVLPDKNLTALRYFFGFLHNVSKRCRYFFCWITLLRFFFLFIIVFVFFLSFFSAGVQRIRWTAVICL